VCRALPPSATPIPSPPGGEATGGRGSPAALRARQVAEFPRSCRAVELLVAAQALDFPQPLRAGRGVAAAYRLLRESVPTLDVDREIHRDIEAVGRLIDSGALLEAARAA